MEKPGYMREHWPFKDIPDGYSMPLLPSIYLISVFKHLHNSHTNDVFLLVMYMFYCEMFCYVMARNRNENLTPNYGLFSHTALLFS